LLEISRAEKERTLELIRERERRLDRDQCEARLIDFVKGGWKYIDPNPYVHGWHLEAVAEHLEAVVRGEIRNLLINVPPRTSKSSITSVAFPAWVWAQRDIGPLSGPQVQFLFASYSHSISMRDSVKTRRMVESPWYQERWGDRFDLTGDQNTKVRFETSKGGYRLATSTGGSLTGEGAAIIVCLTRDAVLVTDKGEKTIGEIVEGSLNVRVLGYNHATNSPSWQTIEAHERNPVRPLYRVRIGGREIKCTGDHPIYIVGRGYTKAEEVRKGEAAVCLSPLFGVRLADASTCQDLLKEVRVQGKIGGGAQSEHAAMLRLLSANLPYARALGAVEGAAVLQPQVSRRWSNWFWQRFVSRHCYSASVPSLRQGVCGFSQIAVEVLLSAMRWSAPLEATGPAQGSAARMSELQTDIYAAKSRAAALFKRVLGKHSCSANAWRGQRSLCSWRGSEAVLRWLDAKAQTACEAAGRLLLPSLQSVGVEGNWDVARPSYRLRQDEHAHRKPDFSLPDLSRQDAWPSREPGTVEVALVEAVERIPDEPVFNVRVGPDHNYFANGILVHNCDDAHNAIEAESEVIRKGVLSWWDEALSTRLNDPKTGAFVVVMQRLHQEDLAGHILSKNTGDWCHLCLPMEYDPGRHCVTSIGWEDPRTDDGELLCPERFGPDEVRILKSRLGPTATAGQLQQIPEPKGGGILKRDWWGVYELELGAQPRHQFEYVVASLDPAFTSKQENDPSGFVVLGVYRDMGRPKVVLLHAWKKWLELHGRTIEREHNEDKKTFIRRAMPEWGLVEWVAHDCSRLRVNQLLIEDKASGHSVAQEIKRLYFDKNWGVSLVNPGTLDKRARAYAVQHMFADGMIEAPAATRGEVYEFREFAQMAIDECAKFRGLPGDEDNVVDALTQALKYIRDRGIAQRADEVRADEEFLARHKPKSELPYDV